MTTILEYERNFAIPSDDSFEGISVPQSSEEVDRLQDELLKTGNNLRQHPDLELAVKEKIIHKLAEGVEMLAGSPVEDFRKVLIASEIAADVSSVMDTSSPIIETVQELIDERYAVPTGNERIDELNREQRDALLLAIQETNPETPFFDALATSTAEVDAQIGRSYYEDVIVPTSNKIRVVQDRDAAIKARNLRIATARAVGNYEPEIDDTVEISMAQYLGDDYEVEAPFNRREATMNYTTEQFRTAVQDDENERIPKQAELDAIRAELDAIHKNRAA